ncbi:TPA: hypothetical protein RVG64_003243 [Escherichia coli]|uniref:hypothetical protein n=3 Tax=Escherichia coli TaxID=562 RepID=UPI0012FFD842|nr:hypothetical protein [Escherichia coli]HEA2422648.1 hypothetical protein [Escherichia coli]
MPTIILCKRANPVPGERQDLVSFKLLQHRRQVGAFLEQQLPVQLENVLQVAAEYAPHELVTYGLPGHSHQPITHGRLRAIQPKIRMVQ